MSLTLVIGNRNYSSWSLRAWLYLRESGLEFEEIFISLHIGNWREEVSKYTPAGRVPVLIDDDITVWDTMAIMAYLLDRHPNAIGWPADPTEKALAQSISAEMHKARKTRAISGNGIVMAGTTKSGRFCRLAGEGPQNSRLPYDSLGIL